MDLCKIFNVAEAEEFYLRPYECEKLTGKNWDDYDGM